MDRSGKPSLQWEGKFGPAAIIGSIQTIIIVIGGVITVARMQDGIENARSAVVELRSIVSEMQRSSLIAVERVTKVEAQNEFIVRSLDRIEKKMEAPVRFAPPP